ncbi:MAG: transporter substrate-binding domain-containing protein [Clostridia bacterium]|nr:transporter substrate-binding domain-containing protein [Clostridia bacterium]
MNLKKVFSLLLAFLLMFSLVACSSSGEGEGEGEAEGEPKDKLARIQESGKLVVGTSADYPPYEFHALVDGKDTIVGVDIAVAQVIADHLGVELEIKDMQFDSLLTSLQAGQFDIVLAALTPDEERAKVVDFTEELYENKQVVLVRAEDAAKYTDQASFAGTTLAALKGTVQEEIALDLTGADANVIKLPEFENTIMELKSGKVDGVCAELEVATSFTVNNPDLTVVDVGIESNNTGFAAAVQKADDNASLIAAINEVVAKLEADGSVDQFFKDAYVLTGVAIEPATPDPLLENPTGKLAEILDAGKLVVGTSADYPPYEFHTMIDGKDTIVGFDIAIAQDFADRLGVEMEIVDMQFNGLITSLQNGEFDLVMAALTPDEERSKVVDFTDVLFENKQIVIVRTEDAAKYTDKAAFAGTKLACQAGTIQEDIALDLTGNDANVVKLPKFDTAILELKNGQVDGVCTNVMVASAFTSAHSDITIVDVGIEVEIEGFSGAVQKTDDNDTYLQFLNNAIAEMQAAGTIQKYVEEAQALANGAEG